MTVYSTTAQTTRLERWLCASVLLVLAAFALVFLAVALVRARYPFDLDFLEDDVLLEAWRFAQGLPVFVPPNADFVPHAYAPLYMLLSAALFKLAGPAYLPMRLLSMAATLASAGVLYAGGRLPGCRRSIALLAPGLFCAGYALTGFEYDLARVDALSIALMLAGTLAGIGGAQSRRRRVTAALLLALAFFAKQTALVFGPAMALYLLVSARRQAVDFLVVYSLAVALPLGAMHGLTGGWSTTYLVVVPQADPVSLDRVASYIRHDLARSLGPLCAILALAAVARRQRRLPFGAGGGAWLLFTLLAIFISGWARARLGGNANSLMPAYAFLCLAPAIALGDTEAWQTLRPALKSALTAGVYLIVVLQCALGLYSPASEMPTLAMQQSGERLIAALRQAPGPVLVVEHPYYALLAGKAPGVALTALWHAGGRGSTLLPADLRQRFRDRYYSMIVGDEGTYLEVEALMAEAWRDTYAPAQALGALDAPPTLDGLVVQPRYLFMPK